MKSYQTRIVVGVIGYYLLTVAALVEVVAVPGRPNATAKSQVQREYSDLQQDEGSLISDINRLRRDLRAGAGVFVVAKERNLVREDLLNIVLDRMEPAAQSQDLARDQEKTRIKMKAIA